MAVTPVGVAVTQKQTDIDKIFQTIGLSSEGGSNTESEKRENGREHLEDEGRERERECRISSILRSGIESNLTEIKESLALQHSESEEIPQLGVEEKTANNDYSAEKLGSKKFL